jgi:hypothetical protein
VQHAISTPLGEKPSIRSGPAIKKCAPRIFPFDYSADAIIIPVGDWFSRPVANWRDVLKYSSIPFAPVVAKNRLSYFWVRGVSATGRLQKWSTRLAVRRRSRGSSCVPLPADVGGRAVSRPGGAVGRARATWKLACRPRGEATAQRSMGIWRRRGTGASTPAAPEHERSGACLRPLHFTSLPAFGRRGGNGERPAPQRTAAGARCGGVRCARLRFVSPAPAKEEALAVVRWRYGCTTCRGAAIGIAPCPTAAQRTRPVTCDSRKLLCSRLVLQRTDTHKPKRNGAALRPIRIVQHNIRLFQKANQKVGSSVFSFGVELEHSCFQKGQGANLSLRNCSRLCTQ